MREKKLKNSRFQTSPYNSNQFFQVEKVFKKIKILASLDILMLYLN